MIERVVGRGRHLSRWALLVLLVIGVCGMHTLGHPGSSHGQSETAVASMPMGHMPPSIMDGAVSSSGELPDLDPGTVCLAVLTSLLLLFLDARRGRLIGRGETPFAAGPDTGRAGRPPPRFMALELIRVSVLRV
ncbi:DUF6153 family protein [Nonomuraea lactucae]|uniref:DUF6153 family protein n=1 Tax=Nonomuraea lactucae TaxID=2249762 RepID=UPI000DE32BA6|nr:DUF6153 family protein [Nonomuraea lactucae]